MTPVTPSRNERFALPVLIALAVPLLFLLFKFAPLFRSPDPVIDRIDVVRLALESFHAKNHRYPADLGELVPEFLSKEAFEHARTAVPDKPFEDGLTEDPYGVGHSQFDYKLSKELGYELYYLPQDYPKARKRFWRVYHYNPRRAFPNPIRYDGKLDGMERRVVEIDRWAAYGNAGD